jgi:hypothetical protein
MADARLKTPTLWLPAHPLKQETTFEPLNPIPGGFFGRLLALCNWAVGVLNSQGMSAGVAEWQTRGTQNPVSARA